MTLTIGTNTWPIRLGDDATTGSGSYEIFFNSGGNIIDRNIQYPDSKVVEVTPVSKHIKFTENHKTTFEVIYKLNNATAVTNLYAIRSILNYWYVYKTVIYVSYKFKINGTEYDVLKYPTSATVPSTGSYGETIYSVKIDEWNEELKTETVTITFKFTMEK